MSFSSVWDRRELQQRLLPGLRATAARHRPVLEEWSVDLAPGREVRDLVAPLAELAPVRLPQRPCPKCWGQKRIWEPGVLGLVPVVCDGCAGRGLV